MKRITYMKTVEVETTIEHPTITFVAEKTRISPNGDTSWEVMAYIPRFNGLTRSEYCKSIGMTDRIALKMLEAYIKETYSNCKSGYGSIDWHYYSGKDLGLPELPKIEDSNFRDDHQALVNMFKNA